MMMMYTIFAGENTENLEDLLNARLVNVNGGVLVLTIVVWSRLIFVRNR